MAAPLNDSLLSKNANAPSILQKTRVVASPEGSEVDSGPVENFSLDPERKIKADAAENRGC